MDAPRPTPRVEFPVRRGRNAAALALLLVLSGLALYVAYVERESLSLAHWWIPVFPLLAAVTAYRLVRPRVPLILDDNGLRVANGHTLLGLRTAVDWRSVRRIRVTAGGLILVEMRDWESWAADKPWLVRANMRTNERKYKAAVVQPLRELQGTPEQIVQRLHAGALVRVDAPEGWRAGKQQRGS